MLTNFSDAEPGNKIAVISAACRFSEAENLELYWDILYEGKSCFTKFPKDRINIDAFYNQEPGIEEYLTYQCHGAFMKNIYDFDNEFFNIKPEDAICMDPQQRICLELTQELFDRAGYTKEEVKGKNIGLYIGATETPYYRSNLKNMNPIGARSHAMLTLPNMIAGRISDFYDLKGESLILNTACSTSLVAIHMACKSLQNQHVDMAIAGGIMINEGELDWVSFSKAKALAHGSVMYVFDERADGFIPGDGAGLVLLKRFEDALRDGDEIKAVILGSSVNNDGKTLGVTTPNLKAQKALIEMGIKNSRVSPKTISYYEAHGTGTQIGDPIEIKAATEVYQQYTDKIGYCALGSVKSNIGHTALAAGVASFIKILLSFKHKVIPSTLNCEFPHPRLNFSSSPFFPNTSRKLWESNTPRRAALSAFGFGGTNAHVIMQEATLIEQNISRKPLPLTEFKRKTFTLK